METYPLQRQPKAGFEGVWGWSKGGVRTPLFMLKGFEGIKEVLAKVVKTGAGGRAGDKGLVNTAFQVLPLLPQDIAQGAYPDKRFDPIPFKFGRGQHAVVRKKMIHPVRSCPNFQIQTLVVSTKQVPIVNRHLVVGQSKNPKAFGTVITGIGIKRHHELDPFVFFGLEHDRHPRVFVLVGGRVLLQKGLIPRNLQFAPNFEIVSHPSVGTPLQAR